jgi:hypothetical protein
MAGPADRTAGAAAGRGRLRASRADRDLVIDVLKAAFVQGRLTRDELDGRLDQALAARTHAELAAVTADIPADLALAQPRVPAPAQARPPMNNAVKTSICLAVVGATLLVSYFTSEYAFAMFVFFYFMGLIVAVAQVLASRHERRSSRRAIREP